MSLHIDQIFNKYREDLARRNPNESILNLTFNSSFSELFAGCPLKTLEKFIYWMILFLKKLEEVEPPRTDVDHRILSVKLSECIEKVMEHRHIDEKSTFLEYIDEILSNELQSCTEINTFITWVEISKKLTNSGLSESMMYKKTAFLYSNRWIFELFKQLNDSENLENVPNILDYLYRIYTSNIIIKELNNLIVDYVIEYIEIKYLNKVVSSNEFQNSYRLIDKLNHMIDSEDVKQEIMNLHDRCAQKYPPNLIDNLRISDQPVQNHVTLDPRRITINESSRKFKDQESNKYTISFCNGKLDSREDVFIKTYESTRRNLEDLKICEVEISILEKLSAISSPSNCFLEYKGTFTKDSSINLVMQKIDETLTKFIEKNKKPSLTQPSIAQAKFLKIAKKLVTSFHCMIEQKISHHDIKPDNILIDDQVNETIIKIIDFNISLIKRDDITIQHPNKVKVKGTYHYLCPQRKKAWDDNKGLVSIIPEKSDVYSLGLIFVQLLTSMDISDKNSIENRLDMLNMIDGETKYFIRAMLSHDPEDRPSFKDLIGMIDIKEATVSDTRLSN